MYPADLHSYFDRCSSLVTDFGGDAFWHLLKQATRVDLDPGALAPLLRTLSSLLATAERSEVGDAERRHALRSLVVAAQKALDSSDGSALIERQNPRNGQGSRCSGTVHEFPFLHCLTLEVQKSLESRVNVIRTLLLFHILKSGELNNRVIVISDGLRKARANRHWTAVIDALPKEEEDPLSWPQRIGLAAGNLQQKYVAGAPGDAAKLDFLAAVAWVCEQQPARHRATVPRAIRTDPPKQPSSTGRWVRRIPDNGDIPERKLPPIETILHVIDTDGSQTEPQLLDVQVLPPVNADETVASAPTDAVFNKRTAYRLAEIGHCLRWDWDHLNFYDLKIVISKGVADLDDISLRTAPALFVLLIIVTGIDAVDLPRIGLRDNGGEYFQNGIWIKPVPQPHAAWEPEPGADSLLRSPAITLSLRLPAPLQQTLLKLQRQNPGAATVGELVGCTATTSIDFVSRWLQPLRESNPNSRLTHGRLARALRVEINAQTHDDTITHAIAGRAIDVPPVASYYSSFSSQKAEQAYQNAWAKLFSNLSIPVETSPLHQTTHEEDLFVGSRVLPKHDHIVRFVKNLRMQVEQSLQSDAAICHNAFTFYCLWLLLLATGHRPVKDPFESLDNMDVNREWFLINDKASSSAKETRLVPLGHVAQEQLNEYCAHLKRLSDFLGTKQPELAERIRSVLPRRGVRSLPLFFLIDPQTYKWRSISSGELSQSLSSLPGTPPNFGRHFLAAAAIERSWNIELVREVLGHIENGSSAFSTTSPLAPVVLRDLGAQINALLIDTGWACLTTVNADWTYDNAKSAASPSSVPTISPVALGSAQRQAARAIASNAILKDVNQAMRSALEGKSLKDITQNTVDAAFRAVLNGRSIPTDLASLKRYSRLNSRMRFLKDRYSLQVNLPPQFSELPLEPAAFKQNFFVDVQAYEAACDQFSKLILERSRRSFHLDDEARVAEMIVSLILHSWVLDANIIRTFVKRRFAALVDTPLGIFFELQASGGASHSSLRRYAAHPITSLLISRAIPALPSSLDIRKLERDVVRIAVAIDSNSVDAKKKIGTFNAALGYLIQITAPAARLELPSNARSYLEGIFEPVSLPRAAFVRVLHGRPPLNIATLNNIKTHEARDQDRNTDFHPISEYEPRNTSSSEKEQHCRGVQLHKRVCALITQIVKNRGVDKESASSSYMRANRQRDHLRSEILSLLKTTQAPRIATLLARWLAELCEDRDTNRALRASSCATYYQVLARSLIDLAAGVNIDSMTADGLGEIYADCLAAASHEHRAYRYARLREFHRFLMHTEGFPEVDWSDITPVELLVGADVDAGIITWPEYERAFKALIEDPFSDIRTAHAQALILFFMFRFGARLSEALGLRRKDIVIDDETIVVLFRHNDFREIKSDNGIRQVPLLGALSTMERSALDRWMAHIDEFCDDPLSALFSGERNARSLMDRALITSRITDALAQATGDTNMRCHYARHSFATRLELLMTLESREDLEERNVFADNLLGIIDPVSARMLLLDSALQSKRGSWAVSMAVGHGVPGTTAHHYQHLTDVIAALHVRKIWAKKHIRLDITTISYIAGIPRDNVAPWRRHKQDGRVFVDESLVRSLVSAVLESSKDGLQRTPKVALSPIVKDHAAILPHHIDAVVELLHRGRKVDSIEDVLLIPAPSAFNIVKRAEKVLEYSHYGIEKSEWKPLCSSEIATRVGKRSASETNKTLEFLRRIAPQLVSDRSFANLARKAGEHWKRHFSPAHTELIVPQLDVLSDIMTLLFRAGIPSALLELRVGKGGFSVETVRQLADNANCKECTVIESDRLPLAGSTIRRFARNRVGVVLRENANGPLTSMAQLHRALCSLAVVAESQDS